MANSPTLSVRLRPEARRILDQAARKRKVAGASRLARQILEQWAERERAIRRKPDLERVAAHLREHPDWGDDPADFFPLVREVK
jgi:hypothetical protein